MTQYHSSHLILIQQELILSQVFRSFMQNLLLQNTFSFESAPPTASLP